MITTDSSAKKIEGTDNWRGIFDAQNGTAEAVDQLTEDVAIVINGNKTTHTGGAASGQYVLVRNSTITDITDGLYTAAKAIPSNTAIDKTYLTAVSGGGLNALNSNMVKLYEAGNIAKQASKLFPLVINDSYLVITTGGAGARCSATVVMRSSNNTILLSLASGSDVTVTGDSSGMTIANANASYGANYFIIKLG